MRCKYCGTEVNDNAKICTECGRKAKNGCLFLCPLVVLVALYTVQLIVAFALMNKNLDSYGNSNFDSNIAIESVRSETLIPTQPQLTIQHQMKNYSQYE